MFVWLRPRVEHPSTAFLSALAINNPPVTNSVFFWSPQHNSALLWARVLTEHTEWNHSQRKRCCFIPSPCLTLVSVAVINTMVKKFVSAHTLCSIMDSSQGGKERWEPRSRSRSRSWDHEEHCLLPCSAWFLRQHRTTCTRVALP